MILISARPFPTSVRLSPLSVLGSSASPVSPLPLSCIDQDPCHVLYLHIQSSKYWWSHTYWGSLLLLHLRKHFFTMRVVKHWGRLPRDVVKSPSVDIFKTWLGMVLGNLLQLTLLEQGVWPTWSQEVCFQPRHFCNSPTSFLSCIWKISFIWSCFKSFWPRIIFYLSTWKFISHFFCSVLYSSSGVLHFWHATWLPERAWFYLHTWRYNCSFPSPHYCWRCWIKSDMMIVFG